MTARTIAGALPQGAVATGSVLLDGEDLLTMSHRRRRAVRKAVGMIFQDPRAFIDPLWRVEDHLTEGLRVHLGMSRSEARRARSNCSTRLGSTSPNGVCANTRARCPAACCNGS